jgi:glycine betaine catabolism B
MIVLSEEGFVKVSDTKDIQPSHMKEVQVDGESICIVNVEGKYYAIGNICTHEGGPLADGTLEGYEVECPWHGSKFDVRTGEVKEPPASEPESVYQIKVDGNNILLKKQDKKSKSLHQIELTLMEKDKVDSTDVMCLPFVQNMPQIEKVSLKMMIIILKISLNITTTTTIMILRTMIVLQKLVKAAEAAASY